MWKIVVGLVSKCNFTGGPLILSDSVIKGCSEIAFYFDLVIPLKNHCKNTHLTSFIFTTKIQVDFVFRIISETFLFTGTIDRLLTQPFVQLGGLDIKIRCMISIHKQKQKAAERFSHFFCQIELDNNVRRGENKHQTPCRRH